MNNWFLICTIAALFAACGPSSPDESDVEIDQAKRSEMLQEIEDLRQQTFEEEVRIDRAVGHELMKKYIAYANTFPKDSLTPQFLFSAASVGQSLGRYRQAINLLENLHDGFPEFDQRVEAGFLIGFIYQNDLNDRLRAEECYNKIIDLYPESEWAEVARSSLVTLNMTEEDLLKFLDEQKAQAEPSNP